MNRLLFRKIMRSTVAATIMATCVCNVYAMPNPVQDATSDEVMEMTGIQMIPFDSAENVSYKIIGDTMAEMDFSYEEKDYYYRAEFTDQTEAYDMSGLYYEWESEGTTLVQYCQANYQACEEGASLYWIDTVPGVDYTLGCTEYATIDEMTDVALCCFHSLQGIESDTTDITPNTTQKSMMNNSMSVFTNYGLPFYGVWCSSSTDINEAYNFCNNMRYNGFNANVYCTSDWSDLNQGTWYAVSVGTASTYAEAEAIRNDVAKMVPNAYIKYTGAYKRSSMTVSNNNGFPFYGVWCSSSTDINAAYNSCNEMRRYGFYANVFRTSDWSDLNQGTWYAVSVGTASSYAEAEMIRADVAKAVPSAYVKYTGAYKY